MDGRSGARAAPSRLGGVLVPAGMLLVLVALFAPPAIGLAVSSTAELPLSNVECVAVDSRGQVYLWLDDYHRVQVYDAHGRFAGGWAAPDIADAESRTEPVLDVDGQDRLQLAYEYRSRSRSGALRAAVYTYGSDHRLVDRRDISSHLYDVLYGVPHIYWHARSGQLYTLERAPLPRIVRRDPDGSTHVVVTAPVFTVLLDPFTGLLVTGVGMALLWRTGGVRIVIRR